MRVKTYEAASMQEALAMIKEEMGEEASILSNKTRHRTRPDGSRETYMEVTAAVDEANLPEPALPVITDGTYGLRPPLASTTGRSATHAKAAKTASIANSSLPQPPAWQIPKFPQKQLAPEPSVDLQPIRRELVEIRGAVEALKEQEARNSSIYSQLDQLKTMLNRIRHGMAGAPHQLPPALMSLYGDLAANDVDPTTAVRLCEYTQRALVDQGGEENIEPDKVRIFMRRVISDFIPIAAPIQLDPNKVQVAALVGPTGVGKTTTIAKLAAYAKLNLKQKVALLSMDTFRIGGADQLQQYAQILQVPVHVIITVDDLKNALNFYQNHALVLIDTPGHQQGETDRLEQLGTFLEALPLVETHLVLSATAKPRDLIEVEQRYERLRPNRLIFTKLDETCTYGPILSTVIRVKRPLSYLGTGQEIPQDLELATSRRIADLILPPAQVAP
ncbi:MAG: flagellar biosynthesis protein FlhF [Holophagaceae bacterium]|nr:flagellar biosynthesis protein FlhF [Holophagaceae bacterium]